VLVRVCDAAYAQVGYPIERAYLDATGAALRLVDFRADPDAVAHDVNAFVAEATNDRIPHLVGDGVFTREMVLALVNALYLKASWTTPFEPSSTADGPFTLLDGSTSTVPFMHGGSSSSASGEGWIGCIKPLVGSLAVQFVLPDPGRLDDASARFGVVVAEYESVRTMGSTLVLPRFEARFGAELSAPLAALGLRPLWEEGSFLGIADDPTLVLDLVIHEAFVAMDEAGIEAAAATVLAMQAAAMPARPPVPVVLDRPFLFRVFDQQTGMTLFLGRITDP
jgi:serpin B